MSEFKYACPVCGQHMKCDSSQAGSVMECPTCFQKITVPQAPASDDQKLIITGTKAGERPVPKIPGDSRPVPQKKSPGGGVVLIILIGIAVVVGFVYHGTIFKPANSPMAATNSMPSAENKTAIFPATNSAQTNSPLADTNNLWTLNVDSVVTPDLPVGGKVHGKNFMAQRVILNGDGLTIRTAENPPEAGVTIYLRPNPIQSVFGKTIFVKPDAANAPMLNLRWKDAQGQAMQQSETGYALRIEFGQPSGGHLPGKIYLCAPDEMKSYVVGNFNADIAKPKPQ
jgi:DNA-directed RNA polymerase subunit RPC12/RpoP